MVNFVDARIEEGSLDFNLPVLLVVIALLALGAVVTRRLSPIRYLLFMPVLCIAGSLCTVAYTFSTFWIVPRTAPDDDAVSGTVVTPSKDWVGDGHPVAVARVTIVCAAGGGGRPIHAAFGMVGPSSLSLRTDDGRLVDVDVPRLGEWADSREWRDVTKLHESEYGGPLASLDGVPYGKEASASCPRGPWSASIRSVHTGDHVVVGRSVDGRGPTLWFHTPALIREADYVLPEGAERRARAGRFLLALALATLVAFVATARALVDRKRHPSRYAWPGPRR